MRANLMAALLGLLCVAGCGSGGTLAGAGGGGGGGTNPTGSNVQPLTVDTGPTALVSANRPAVNTLYTSVTICVPGSSTCQTIDHIQVDTGSSGLRIIASELAISLPVKKDASGNVMAECAQFADGSSWGTLRTADVKISGETASNLTVHAIGDGTYAVPSTCTSTSGKTENTVVDFGANGILGVGPFVQDCGSSCTVDGGGVYFTCTSTSTPCASTAIALTAEVSNPVAFFATDNNGVLIEVGAVNGTASSVSGSLIFGIGTQGNNGLGGAKVYTLNGTGGLSTTYNGAPLSSSFIDSGSNALYFPDTIHICDKGTTAAGFFCPPSTLNLSATIVGMNGQTANVNFTVADANSLFPAGATVAAASTLAGPSTGAFQGSDPSNNGNQTFDWGLPFYYGRSVYTAIEGQNTSAGAGPYFAF